MSKEMKEALDRLPDVIAAAVEEAQTLLQEQEIRNVPPTIAELGLVMAAGGAAAYRAAGSFDFIQRIASLTNAMQNYAQECFDQKMAMAQQEADHAQKQ
jgi:hypothetical protein